jgi:hypothetical protein
VDAAGSDAAADGGGAAAGFEAVAAVLGAGAAAAAFADDGVVRSGGDGRFSDEAFSCSGAGLWASSRLK